MARISWFDDEPFFVAGLRQRLVREGHTVESYETVTEALEHLDRMRSSDLIILDLIALSREDRREFELFGGLEVLNRLSAGGASPPILVFSVATPDAIRNAAMESATALLEKPATGDQLCDAVGRLPSERASGRDGRSPSVDDRDSDVGRAAVLRTGG